MSRRLSFKREVSFKSHHKYLASPITRKIYTGMILHKLGQVVNGYGLVLSQLDFYVTTKHQTQNFVRFNHIISFFLKYFTTPYYYSQTIIMLICLECK